MSENKQLTQEQLQKVSGGTDDGKYIRKCCNCEYEFDIRTVDYKTETVKSQGEGYTGQDTTIFYQCPSCKEYTPTKSRYAD